MFVFNVLGSWRHTGWHVTCLPCASLSRPMEVSESFVSMSYRSYSGLFAISLGRGVTQDASMQPTFSKR